MEHTLKAALVDDEELARRYLRELLASHPEIVVAAECANGFEAVKAIAETSPDLLFLDAQMPKLDGFEVPGADRFLAGAGGHLRHRIRPLCDARLRRPRHG